MPYTPRWQAKFARPLLDQVIALVQRDQLDAIGALAAQGIVDAGLKIINEFHTARMARVAFPWLLVWVSANQMDVESQQTRHQAIELYVAVESGYINQEDAQDAAHQYLAVIDSIIETADETDGFELSLPCKLTNKPSFNTAPWPVGTVKRVQVTGHTVDAIAVEGYDNPAVRATVHVRVELEET